MALRLAFSQFVGSAVGFRADAGLGVVGSPSPDADYWYRGAGTRSTAGPTVSAATSLRLAAVFACTRVCAETLSSLPVGIYRELKSGGREPAKDHPAQELFLRPNPWQTGMEFFEMMQGHLELRGNSFALKVPSGGRAIDQLIPFHPDRVQVYVLPNNRLRYEVTSYSSGHIDKYSQDEILHLRAWSMDGIMGMSTVSAGSEVIGVGLAQQEFRARSFHRPFPGMAIETVKLTPEAEATLRTSLAEGMSGDKAFTAMILPPGMKSTPLSLTNKDQQLIEASGATRTDIAGMWRVPPHKIGDLSKGTFSNIEQQNIEFATDCMRPRIVRSERRLDRDIVGALRVNESASGDYYATFSMDALYRGDMKSRYEAYQLAVQTWMRRNEARANEGLNPIDGLDEILVPVNMETVSQAQKRSDANLAAASAAADASDTANEDDTADNVRDSGGSPETPESGSSEEDEQNAKGGFWFASASSKRKALAKAQLQKARLRALAIACGGRIVRREVKGLRRLVHRGLGSADHDQEVMAREVAEFYGMLAPLISESMVIPMAKAATYCDGHALLVTTEKPSLSKAALEMMIDEFEEESPVTLADLAMGERQERTQRP